MELLLLVFFCLLTGSEVTFGAEPKVIIVEEGSDVTLPCLLREDIKGDKFEWKKDGRQVFLYDAGDHSNIVNTGQDQQFVRRVEHFLHELKSGNASIIIRNTRVADSGDYTCEFTNLQPEQIFHIKLYVAVEAPQPSVRILEQKGKSALLQCEVRGAFPKPELHWEDSEGHEFPADELQETERGGLFYIILQSIVTKTDNYRCVATQKEINHQTHDETYVFVPVLTGGEIVGIVIAAVAVGIVLVVFKQRVRIMIFFLKVKASQPSVQILQHTKRRVVLQCEVRGAFPKPKLYWQDSDGNKLQAAEPHVTKRGRLYDIILQTTVTKTDIYRCVAKQKEINHQTHADKYVYIPETKVITVDEGRDVILPCSLSLEDITKKKFEWKNNNRQVFLYDKDTVNSQTQDQQFKGRVVHFPDEQNSGNASIIIKDMKVTDSGLYTCEFPDLQPSEIFYMRLVVGTTFITVKEGRDVMLPCSLPEDITNKKFEWTKDDRQVFLNDNGDRSNGQDPQFRGRVKHLPNKLKSGDASIIIRNTRVSDRGNYFCRFPDLQPEQIFHIKLDVETTVIRVKEGRDVTLPCSLREDITNKKFEWKKDDRQVFLYDDSDRSNGQDPQFRGRVKHLPNKLKSGDASIIIRNMKVDDSGEYICRFPDLQPEQIFLIQLIVVGTKVIIVNKGSDAILPCSLREDITNKKFEWKKDGRQVFLYDDGIPSNNAGTGQDPQFKGRVLCFSETLKSGNASIIIRDTKVDDNGEYTCDSPDLQPEHTFYVKLIVSEPAATTARDDETAGLLTEKTDGRDVDEAGSPFLNEDSRV